MVGQTISHYKILEKLGQGGMGEVWKAEDTQLRRTVGLKFLSSETVGDDEVKARLVREAQASASLDHPNICQVFGIHEEKGETFIAMAFIEGPSLADKIKERPLPLDEALGIAIQIAEGLQEAHEKGIVHRDIKPQNIMLTQKGQVKVMDFGLASLSGRSRLTKSGTTLGTPAYMAPEQLEGGEVDRRVDIWSLGIVLYEMLTQRTPFAADYEQAVAYAILNEEPEPVTASRSGVPIELDRVIAKALGKTREERYQHCDDLLVDLRHLHVALNERTPVHNVKPAQRDSRNITPWALAGVLALALLASLMTDWNSNDAGAGVTRVSIQLQQSIAAGASSALSPDGRLFVFKPSVREPLRELHIRRLDDYKAHPIVGTANARFPFLSADGQWVGYVDQSAGEIRKTHIASGAEVTIGSYDRPPSMATWAPDGVIYLGSRAGLSRISSEGGELESLTAPSGDAGQRHGHYWPQLLPGGDELLFTASTGAEGSPAILSLATKKWAPVKDAPHGPRHWFAPTGHLLTFRDGRLLATPVDLPNRSVAGATTVVVESMLPDPDRFSIAPESGSLIYASTEFQRLRRGLAWVDRKGNETLAMGSDFRPHGQRIAPSGRFVAINYADGIGKYDLLRGGGIQQVSAPEMDFAFVPVWKPDESGIVFLYRNPEGTDFLMWADDQDAPRQLFESPNRLSPSSWSPRGELAFTERRGSSDIRILKPDGSDSDFLAAGFEERQGEFSPDGSWMAYVSDESGATEVWIVEYPSGENKRKVSVGGGWFPAWSPVGGELFYQDLDERQMMAVEISTRPQLTIGRPEVLFDEAYLSTGAELRNYDVSPDGQRFLMGKNLGLEGVELNLIVNWFDELSRLAPTKD